MRSHTWRAPTSAALAASIAVGALAGGALAHGNRRHPSSSGRRGHHPGHRAPAPRRLSSFKGSCSLSGPVTFTPALTLRPASAGQRVRATGTCSGSLVPGHGKARRLAGAPATFTETSHGEAVSCAAGAPRGSGSLTLPGATIDFAFAERRIAALVTGTATGVHGSSASGFAVVSPSQSPLGVLAACGGKGLAGTVVDISLQTTPEITG